MPGVLVVDIVQAACFTVAISLKDKMNNPGVSFMTIDKCKFRKPIVPGDVLNLKVNCLNKVKMLANLKVNASNDVIHANVYFRHDS